MKRALAAAAAVVIAAALVVGLRPDEASPDDHPNVLVIVWDTVRADRVATLGYKRSTTPNLDRFAADARVYERAISPAIWTPPSHGSLFTGLPPSQHGVNALYKWLDGHHTTLAEVFHDAGYGTYAFSANPYLADDTNLVQGFDTVEHSFQGRWERDARFATASKLIPDDASTDISPKWKAQVGQQASGSTHGYKDAGPVIPVALGAWLDERDDPETPFFAYVNFMEAHIPRVPSMSARREVMTETQLLTSLKTDVAQINLLSYTFGKKEFSPKELQAINRTYDAALIDLDEATSMLFDLLEDRGLLDDTVVVLTSDHGENLGDHHMFGHKYGVWETLTHVPLVIRFPAKVTPGRVTTPVSNLDLFATILDLAGLDNPGTAPLSRSLLRDLTPGPLFTELTAATPVAIQRVDTLHGVDDQARWMRTWEALEQDGYKLHVASDGHEALFHLDEDPTETTNLATEDPIRTTRMRATIAEWRTQFPPYDPDARAPSDAPEALNSATREMLERLGYIEGTADDAGLPAGEAATQSDPADEEPVKKPRKRRRKAGKKSP